MTDLEEVSLPVSFENDAPPQVNIPKLLTRNNGWGIRTRRIQEAVKKIPPLLNRAERTLNPILRRGQKTIARNKEAIAVLEPHCCRWFSGSFRDQLGGSSDKQSFEIGYLQYETRSCWNDKLNLNIPWLWTKRKRCECASWTPGI